MTMPMTSSSALTARSHELADIRFQGRYLCFGSFHVDLKREELFKDGTRLRIPAKVYQVLLALLERPGEVVTRDDLRTRLWPSGTFVNYDANVNTTVNKLRLALGDEAETPQFVETIPRQGYCFLGKVAHKQELPNSMAAIAQDENAAVASEREPSQGQALPGLTDHLRGFLMTGWAAAVLLCGVLIGMGIVLIAHRSS